MKRLSKKQVVFSYYKARGYNNGESVVKAGYRVKDRNSAYVVGCRLAKDVKIQQEIEEQKVNIFDKSVITDEYCLNGLNEIAVHGKIEANRLRARELLAKYKGILTEKVDLTHKFPAKDDSDKEVDSAFRRPDVLFPSEK